MQIHSVLGYPPNKFLQSHGGIYSIENTANGMVYIGQTSDFQLRHRQHDSALRANKHKNTLMQADWNTYGSRVFVFDVLVAFRCLDLQRIGADELARIEHMYWADTAAHSYNRAVPHKSALKFWQNGAYI